MKAAVLYEPGQRLQIEDIELAHDRLLTRKWPLEKINEAYDALLAGTVARLVVVPWLLLEEEGLGCWTCPL